MAWVHCKDVRTATFDDIDTAKAFLELHPLFTEAGRGVVDFPAILEILAKADYTGWLVVEQDHTDKAPYEAAAISHRYLKQILGERGSG